MRMSLRDLQLLLGAKLSIPVSEVTYLVIWEFLKTEQEFETFGRKNASLSKSKRPPIPSPLRTSHKLICGQNTYDDKPNTSSLHS